MNSLDGHSAKKGSLQMLTVNGEARLYNHNQPWTQDESEYVVMNFEQIPLDQLALELGRTPKAIRERYRVLTHPKECIAPALGSPSVETLKRQAYERIISIANHADLCFKSSPSEIVIYKTEQAA